MTIRGKPHQCVEEPRTYNIRAWVGRRSASFPWGTKIKYEVETSPGEFSRFDNFCPECGEPFIDREEKP